MECIIPGANIKILSRLTNALSKIGDDVYLEAQKDSLCLKSVNMTSTAYCTINLYDVFFTTYEITGDENLMCRIPMKGFLSVFKSHVHKDMKPDLCKVELEKDATKIIFRFKYKHDVTVVRSLYLSDGHTVNIVYDENKFVNHIGGSSQVFAQVLANFQRHDEDMSIEVAPQKAVIRNYVIGDLSVAKGIRSQITLMAGEFSSYKINAEGNVTFSLKPFKAAVHFAETHNLNILLNFEKSGRPALIEIKSPTFDLSFLMATLKGDDASESCLSSSVCLTKTKNAPQNQELNNVNWDDFNEPMDTESCDDFVCRSPESPRSKRIKFIFGRCYDETFRRDTFSPGELLAPDSDPESD